MAVIAAAGNRDFQSLVLCCNKDGMDSLRKGQAKAAFEQFKYAESMLLAQQNEGDNTSLMAVTCNNLGCYYKKVGKEHGALSYLRRALKMEIDLGTDEVTVAGTHLNICAILSKLEKHDKAVQHALSALDLINHRVNSVPANTVSQDDYSVLAIAYHNVAVERDHLQQYEKAAAAFKQGAEVAKRCLGEDHPLAITLGKNCDSVLQKSQKLTKAPPRSLATTPRAMMDDACRMRAASPRQVLNESGGKLPPLQSATAPLPLQGATSLPPLPTARPSSARTREQTAEATTTMPMSARVRQQAADWAANEASAWNSFAHSALTGKALGSYEEETTQALRLAPAGVEERAGLTRPPPLQASTALRDSHSNDFSASLSRTPRKGMRDRDLALTSPSCATKLSGVGSGKTGLHQAMEDHTEALMDIIDADRTGHQVANTRQVQSDFRPNRQIKGSTRTARVVRRTGLHNSTKHRDEVLQGVSQSAMSAQKSVYVQKMAAERIQRAWRAYYKYCRENADWMTTTWLCATMIQAKWRSYHVRRLKLDKAAGTVQRMMRGHLVRRALRKHRAAVTIQRHAVGMNTRKQLRGLHRASVRMQALVRGGLARKKVRAKRQFMTKTVLTIQNGVRGMIARRRVRELRQARDLAVARTKAATNIQRSYRGHLGRRRFKAHRQKYERDLLEYNAAAKLQAMVRRDAAIKKVDLKRAEKLDRMHKAATFVRKMWLGAKARKKFKALLEEFAARSRQIVTLQRHARGFLVRLRMWREAVRMEERLWAALEIQRIWRGYCGRVRWEDKYEEVWRREMAALMLQRRLRGWVARQKIGRQLRRIARAEFELARQRFRSAQRVQALARGVLTRKITHRNRARKVTAAIHMQRHWRGFVLRKRLWQQVIALRTTMIQAASRGFLVRNRRRHLCAKVICIQRCWRTARKRPEEVRDASRQEMQRRKESSARIQQQFRKRREEQEVGRLQQQKPSAAKK